MTYGSIPDQGTKELSSSLYNPLHKGLSILSTNPYTSSDHITNTMVDIYTSGDWLIIISPFGAEPSICIDSCFSSSEKNRDWVDSLLETTTFAILDQVSPDIVICLPLGLLVSTTS